MKDWKEVRKPLPIWPFEEIVQATNVNIPRKEMKVAAVGVGNGKRWGKRDDKAQII